MQSVMQQDHKLAMLERTLVAEQILKEYGKKDYEKEIKLIRSLFEKGIVPLFVSAHYEDTSFREEVNANFYYIDSRVADVNVSGTHFDKHVSGDHVQLYIKENFRGDVEENFDTALAILTKHSELNWKELIDKIAKRRAPERVSVFVRGNENQRKYIRFEVRYRGSKVKVDQLKGVRARSYRYMPFANVGENAIYINEYLQR